MRGVMPPELMAGMATTIGCVATDAVLTKAQAKRLAQVAHDGLARRINPVHTMWDGDTVFALATGKSGLPGNMMLLAVMAAEVMAEAVLRAVPTRDARGRRGRAGRCRRPPSSAEGIFPCIAARASRKRRALGGNRSAEMIVCPMLPNALRAVVACGPLLQPRERNAGVRPGSIRKARFQPAFA